MIAVVADDFTGAAELAGVSLRFGLRCELQSGGPFEAGVDVIVLDTNTRAELPAVAARCVAEVAETVRSWSPEWVYKKTDSVLRGNVVEEVQAFRDGLRSRGALLLPGNPARGRVVRDGRLLVNGVPLDQSEFAEDPEYRTVSSDVLRLLGLQGGEDVRLVRPGEPIPEAGLVIAEAREPDDVDWWATHLPEGFVPAGASEFFAALVRRQFAPRPPQKSLLPEVFQGRILIICGTRTQEQLRRNPSVPLCEVFLSEDGVDPGRKVADQCQRAAELLHRFHRLFLVPRSGRKGRDRHGRLTYQIAEVVQQVIELCPVDEIIVEGGSTASTIVRSLGWLRWEPVTELIPGVVRLRYCGGPSRYLTVKPGSYGWPQGMLDLLARGCVSVAGNDP